MRPSLAAPVTAALLCLTGCGPRTPPAEMGLDGCYEASGAAVLELRRNRIVAAATRQPLAGFKREMDEYGSTLRLDRTLEAVRTGERHVIRTVSDRPMYLPLVLLGGDPAIPLPLASDTFDLVVLRRTPSDCR